MSQAGTDTAVMDHQRDDEARRRLKAKNWVLCAALVAFVVIVYLVSIVRMGAGAG